MRFTYALSLSLSHSLTFSRDGRDLQFKYPLNSRRGRRRVKRARPLLPLTCQKYMDLFATYCDSKLVSLNLQGAKGSTWWIPVWDVWAVMKTRKWHDTYQMNVFVGESKQPPPSLHCADQSSFMYRCSELKTMCPRYTSFNPIPSPFLTLTSSMTPACRLRLHSTLHPWPMGRVTFTYSLFFVIVVFVSM